MSNLAKCSYCLIQQPQSDPSNSNYPTRFVVLYDNITLHHRFICFKPGPIETHMEWTCWIQNSLLIRAWIPCQIHQHHIFVIWKVIDNVYLIRMIWLPPTICSWITFIPQLVAILFDVSFLPAIEADLIAEVHPRLTPSSITISNQSFIISRSYSNEMLHLLLWE